MLVDRQRAKECMLVTIAALADRPYPEVRAYARKIMGKPWASHWGRKASTRSPISFRSAVLDVASEFGGVALATLVDSNARNGGGSLSTALPAVGRGVVRFANKRKRWSGHIAPWADGLIHDTDGSAPCTLDEYLTRHAYWARLDYVRSIAFDGNPEDNPNPTSPDMGY
jgi:hypothetical protein